MNKKVLVEFIKKFYNEYGITPSTGFLAGYFKVTIHTINRRLVQLDEEKVIKRIKKEKNNTSYIIL